ncbi:MAG: hypothetical protein NZ908_00870 [Candidatus Micrarchaeota archaeon]|nr:hypothetical protein [Candidatus Micrarchaeota archaeon]MCX8154697.1 hypothetical protein [Candidatus Micrarchaeota archaeon]
MVDRKLLLGLLVVAGIISLVGYLTSFKFGIDFAGGLIITITSNSSLDIPLSYSQRSAGGVYIYEIPMRLDRELKEVIDARSNLVECIRSEQNLSICESHVDKIYRISGLPLNNTSYQEYADRAMEYMLEKTIDSVLSRIEGEYSYSYNLITPVLSTELFSRILSIFLLGMVFITIYIILTFKTWFPTINIISGALIDTFITLGIVNLLGFETDLSVLVGLLVLFGYSLDTSVLLVSNYYISRKLESIDQSMRTGISMITSSLLVFIIIFMIGTILEISFLKSIGAVLIVGLIVDFMTSWGYNAYLIQKYGDRYG